MAERVAMMVRLDAEDHALLRRIAFDRRLSMNEIVRRAVHSVVSAPEEQDFLLAPADRGERKATNDEGRQ